MNNAIHQAESLPDQKDFRTRELKKIKLNCSRIENIVSDLTLDPFNSEREFQAHYLSQAILDQLDESLKFLPLSKKRPSEEKLKRREGKRPCFQREPVIMENREHSLLFLDKLYKARNETFDVVISLGEENVKAHYWILSQAPFFANLLQKNSQKVIREGRDVTHLALESCFSPNILKNALYFLYFYRLPTKELDILCDLLQMAINYEIKELEEYVFESLKEQLDVQNVFALGNWACTNNYRPLKDIVIDFVLQNVEQCFLKRLPELKAEEELIPQELLIEVLSVDHIRLSESQIAEAVLNWLNQENKRLQREKSDEITISILTDSISNLRKVVRLGLISRDELYDKWSMISIEGIPLFSDKQIYEACKAEVRETTPKRNIF